MPETVPRYLRPGAVDRIFGHTLAFLVWIGLIRGHFYILEIRGRKTGETISLPVDPLDLDGKRYLVCARGNSNWVRNARAAGEVVLARAMRRHRNAVHELPPSERPPVLKAYLDCFASEVQRFFPVPMGGISGRGIQRSGATVPGVRGCRRDETATADALIHPPIE